MLRQIGGNEAVVHLLLTKFPAPVIHFGVQILRDCAQKWSKCIATMGSKGRITNNASQAASFRGHKKDPWSDMTKFRIAILNL